ncbi:MAG: hypothetical protein AMJ69_01945 [Gammaproteobacteria bacterium SG8_47]|nr:MAG: hypothetical protein AMJ69_01945 [Gammaproteobacteria bacterium SG8_47]
MTSQRKTTTELGQDIEKLVTKYLRDHPAFFERHPYLLGEMSLPHESGTAVSLVERQVAVLRDQRDDYKRKLQQLTDAARANERLIERINAIVLALIDAADLDDVVEVVQERLKQDFDADAVVLRLFHTGSGSTRHGELADWSEPALGAFEKVAASRRPICGRLKPGQLESLFGDQAGTISSAALVPLFASADTKTCHGLLAIGSHEVTRFHPEMGTLFLDHLGKAVARILKRHLSN